jgi:hypothetical protein
LVAGRAEAVQVDPPSVVASIVGSLYPPFRWLAPYVDIAIQQSVCVAHETAVGMLDQPFGGPDTCHDAPPSPVVAISKGSDVGPPTDTTMQRVAFAHDEYTIGPTFDSAAAAPMVHVSPQFEVDRATIVPGGPDPRAAKTARHDPSGVHAIVQSSPDVVGTALAWVHVTPPSEVDIKVSPTPTTQCWSPEHANLTTPRLTPDPDGIGTFSVLHRVPPSEVMANSASCPDAGYCERSAHVSGPEHEESNAQRGRNGIGDVRVHT